MKEVAVVLLIVTVIAVIGGSVYLHAEREKAKAEIAKTCIENGGRYHETFFRHRPACK